MNINIRRIDPKYLAIEITVENTTHDLGVFNKEECSNLAFEFEEAVDSLTSGWREDA